MNVGMQTKKNEIRNETKFNRISNQASKDYHKYCKDLREIIVKKNYNPLAQKRKKLKY